MQLLLVLLEIFISYQVDVKRIVRISSSDNHEHPIKMDLSFITNFTDPYTLLFYLFAPEYLVWIFSYFVDWNHTISHFCLYKLSSTPFYKNFKELRCEKMDRVNCGIHAILWSDCVSSLFGNPSFL
ncbi:MAG: hypothetical protein K0R71_2321 [Bacillales bacterium]|jgi:hypothetical protein|nr:hypothetical protein [Bacillales bacterium]